MAQISVRQASGCCCRCPGGLVLELLCGRWSSCRRRQTIYKNASLVRVVIAEPHYSRQHWAWPSSCSGGSIDSTLVFVQHTVRLPFVDRAATRLACPAVREGIYEALTLYRIFSDGRSTVFWKTFPCASSLTVFCQLSNVPVTKTSLAACGLHRSSQWKAWWAHLHL